MEFLDDMYDPDFPVWKDEEDEEYRKKSDNRPQDPEDWAKDDFDGGF